MKKIFLVAFIFFALNAYSQTTYNSSITTKYKSEGEIIEKQRTITVSDKKITITNFVGGTKPLNLIVNKITEKEDDWNGLMKWYYCSEKDVISGRYTDFIIIMKKSHPYDMRVCQKVDEVTFIENILSLE